jgi:hypothetical protein
VVYIGLQVVVVVEHITDQQELIQHQLVVVEEEGLSHLHMQVLVMVE